MSKSKSADWLGLNDHDEDEYRHSNASSDDDDNDKHESRTAGISRTIKRRKVTHSSSGSSKRNNLNIESASSNTNEDDTDEDDDNDNETLESGSDDDDDDDSAGHQDDEETENSDASKPKSKSKRSSRKLNDDNDDDKDIITDASTLKPLTPAELAASREAVRKTGVVYLSRIPPFMRPLKVKALLSRYGEIGRLFLTPEDPKAHARRVKFGGSKKRNYEEGWVEFKNKKDAKMVAETLNTQIIGGKKNNYYHDDVWNIKYLPKFKWHHLQAQIAYENASRQAKLRAEISQATRENKTFIRNVERAKMVENMSKKRKASSQGNAKKDVAGSASRATQLSADVPEVEVRRQFRQNQTKGQKADREQGVQSSDAVKRVLGKIF